MKKANKKLKIERSLPLVWRDAAWTLRVTVRIEPANLERYRALPFLPFRGFNFSQPVISKL